MNDRVREAIETVKQILTTQDIPKVAYALFKSKNPKPSDRWSFFNRLIMVFSGTGDARGYRQWQETGRYVRKGSHALYILSPRIKKLTDEGIVLNPETGEPEVVVNEKMLLTGFLSVPVFRYEDTEGQPLPQDDFNLEIPTDFNPIITELGLKIAPEAFNGVTCGSYDPRRKEIKLATPELKVFLHELAHAADDHLNGISGGQRPDQEIVADYAAAVIGHLKGYSVPMGNVKEYIEHYAKGNGWKEVFALLGRIEKVVSYIIERTSQAEIGTNNAAAGTPAAA